MDSLFLFLFACFVFMLRGTLSSACKMGEQAVWAFRWMIVVALLGLTTQYVIQMEFGFLIAGCSRHHRAGPARRTGHLGQSARVTGSLPTRKAALPSTHSGVRTGPLSRLSPCSDFVFWLCSPMKWYLCHLCVSCNSKTSKTAFFVRILWLSIQGIILRNIQLFACLVNILRILYLFLNLLLYFCKRIYLFYNNVWQRKM